MMDNKIRKPSLDMTGKSVLVTGGSKGLGYAIAASFAMYGANVSITSRHADECISAAKEIEETYGGHCTAICADSSKIDDVDRMVESVVSTYGRIDIFVNNAGVSGETAFIFDQTEENYDYVMDIDLKGLFFGAQKVAEQMKKQGGGKIINMSSCSGLKGSKGISIYSAAKAGVISFTKSMALEWSRYGITVNAVCPYYVLTDINRDFITKPDLKEKIIRDIPLRRYGEVDEIAGPVLAMASDCFGFMNGTHLLLDGGFLAGK